MMFTLYDQDGRLFAQLQFVPPIAHRSDPRLAVQIAANDAAGAAKGVCDLQAHYVVQGRIRKRPDNPARCDSARLTQLPAPCVIEIDGTPYPCADAEADLEFDQPGTYRVVVRAWPHLDKEFIVENPSP